VSLLFDKLVKKPIFGCQQCGQCLLSQTGYVCPMTCPKGLRNGPCGGTVDGMCEVLPDRPCVWLRIDARTSEPEGVHAPFDPNLVETSSLWNFVSGRDRATRIPNPFAGGCESGGTVSDGHLERQIAESGFAITYEIASPKTRAGLARVAQIARTVAPYVDAINTTTNAGGVPSLSSIETAEVVREAGVESVLQYCGRDYQADAFEREALAALNAGFSNILVLTGDWNPNVPREIDRSHWFPMDSLQMVDALARARAEGRGRPFVGVASNPYTTPLEASVERFASKLAAGADFTQTQAVTEVQTFERWLQSVRRSPDGARCRIIASVPLVGRERPYGVLKHLAGVKVAPGFAQAVEGAPSMEEGGRQAALEVILGLLTLGVDGLHLMNFGMPLERVVEIIEKVRALHRANGEGGAAEGKEAGRWRRQAPSEGWSAPQDSAAIHSTGAAV